MSEPFEMTQLRVALAEKDKRIAELERDYDEITRILINTRKVAAEVAAKSKERLSSLQALMEDLDHRWPFCSKGTQPNCPRCAYEKWLKEGESPSNDMEHTVGILSRDRTDAYNNGLRTAIALITEATLYECDRAVLIAGLEGSMLKEEK